MTQDTMERHEQVSALADGQLHGAEFVRAVDGMVEGSDALATWHAYHVLADVLRSRDLAHCADDTAFLTRLKQRLALQSDGAVALVGDADLPIAAEQQRSLAASFGTRVSANDAGWRWKILAGVSLVLSFVAVGWSARLGVEGRQPALVQADPGPASAGVGIASAANAAGGAQGVMIRDPALDALVAAHRQFGGTSALQMPAGFLRNATFEPPAR